MSTRLSPLLAVAATVAFILTIALLSFTCNATHKVGDMYIERKVFENSLQYKEARSTAVATYQAQLAKLTAQLNDPELTQAEREQIRGQIKAIRIRLRVEEGRQ